MSDIIFNRRSVRKYKPVPVPEELINKLLEAAMYAPSAMNLQPWHFVVCRDRDVLSKLMSVHPYSKMLSTAPVCIIVCGSRDNQYYPQDCAAATENILLEACELGLGTCWMGVTPRPERMDCISTVLGLPDEIAPFNMIAVGYPDEVPSKPTRFAANKIHYDRW